MIRVDSQRCTYCGGCVSVCPVEALTLEETQLRVDDGCIECGDCLPACPVGALRLEGEERPEIREPVQSGYDVIVVGAGPGGSIAAKDAAENGLSVLLLEKRQEIGSPVRCAEGVPHEPLIAFIEPDKHWIAAEVDKAEITVIVGDDRITTTGSGGWGYILERRVFDRVLAEGAAIAGAQIRVKTPAVGLIIEDNHVHGVRIMDKSLGGQKEVEIRSQIVIAADGVESQVGRWAGLDLQLSLEDTMVCAQYLLAGVDIDPTCTSYLIGHSIAPGGYAWIFPKGDGVANVGLGVQADIWSGERIGEGSQEIYQQCDDVVVLLERFIESEPRLEKGSPVTLVTGNVPVGISPDHIVMNGLMVVGDAARQVDPLTGGGIINAMTAGRLAAEVAAEAVVLGDTSRVTLSQYVDRWNTSLGRKMKRNYRLRMKFSPEDRHDERFLRAFALAVGG
ncbi:MAG: geranylgeranyl reductase family protein [Anaerolineaceae bacterium]|nr:MAG: geranylgeranyl reductase family protein [Anaerolineaceae bacterium]